MDVTNAGAVPILESALAYSWKRHEVILNNIANSSTPGFRALDLPVDAFQAALRKASGLERRAPVVLGGATPATAASSPDDVLRALSPVAVNGIPGHDGNDVVPEIEAAKMAKNVGFYAAMTQLLSRQFDLIEKAIRERN